jgi:hypothetical protein
MRHYLVVANQTLGHPQLIDTIVACRQAGPCTFHLLVPATQSHAHDHTRWTRSEATAIARCRLEAAVARLKRLGVPVSGEVGDPSPIVAIGEAMNRSRFDTLILSTLPVGASQWLRRGLPQRIERLFHIPVRLIVCGHRPADEVVLPAEADVEATDELVSS